MGNCNPTDYSYVTRNNATWNPLLPPGTDGGAAAQTCLLTYTATTSSPVATKRKPCRNRCKLASLDATGRGFAQSLPLRLSPPPLTLLLGAACQADERDKSKGFMKPFIRCAKSWDRTKS